jgi:ABC-2 type transport system ATP-binding protein
MGLRVYTLIICFKEEIDMVLSVEGLTKKYDKNIANDNINLCFKSGINGLLGENGAGKTTLMKMLVTVLKPTSGQIIYEGKSILENEKHYRGLLGYLPQDFNGYPELSVRDFMYYMGKLKNLSNKKIHTRTKELLQLVSLNDVADKKIRTFSGGMRRRVGIAQALLNEPKILILDEPTAGLDPKERIKFRNIINKISQNSIIILSTHIVSDIENIANNVVIMKRGKVLISGTSEEITSNYKGNVWEVNMSEKKMQELGISFDLGNYKVEEDGSITLRIISNIKPHPTAHQVDVQLEDIFLFQMGEGEKI